MTPSSAATPAHACAEENIAGFCRGFACPAESFDEEVFDCLTLGWSQAVIERMASRASHDSTSTEAGSYLAGIAPLVDRMTALQPAFGAAAEMLASGTRDLRPAVCNLGLTLAAAGNRGSWQLSLDAPARFRMGCNLLPSAGRFELAESSSNSVVCAGGEEVWPAGIANRNAEALATVNFGNAPVACFSYDVAACADLEAVPATLRMRFGNGSVRTIADGIGLLRRCAPEYLRWISRVIAVMILLESRNEMLESGSFPQRVGMLRVSADPRPSAMAEMLVHEASHQYFYILLRLGAVMRNGEDDRFYSPLKERSRPLEKILLGYHAFANVWLLHERLCGAGFEDNFSRLQLDRTRREVQQMGETLARHADFSPLGRAIYDPLAQRLT